MIGRGERKGEEGADPDCGVRVGDRGGRSVITSNAKVDCVDIFRVDVLVGKEVLRLMME